MKRRGRRRERGQVVVLMALFMTVLLGATGLVLDLGMGFVKERDSQTASDAAALQAAVTIAGGGSEDSATDAARRITLQNSFSGSNLALTYLDGFGFQTADPAKVVTIRGNVAASVQTYFMRILGITSTHVSSLAVARVAGTSWCGFCVLDPSVSGALAANGNGDLVVTGTNMAVDSTSPSALQVNGGGNIEADRIGVVGGYTDNGGGTYSPTPVTGINPVPDPLAQVQAPPVPSSQYPSVDLRGGAETIQPGTYCNINVSGQGVLTMSPGIYVITCGLSTSGQGSIIGAGVMLYLACQSYPASCNPGQAGASISLTGNGTFVLTPPTSGPYQGLSIFADRNSTGSIAIAGNGADTFTGTIYAKSAPLTLSGNGGTLGLNSMVVVDTCSMNGNGNVAIAFTRAQNYPPPPIPMLIG